MNLSNFNNEFKQKVHDNNDIPIHFNYRGKKILLVIVSP